MVSEAHVFAIDHFNSWLKNQSKEFTLGKSIYSRIYRKNVFILGTWLLDTCTSEPLAIQRSLTLLSKQSFCDPDANKWGNDTYVDVYSYYNADERKNFLSFVVRKCLKCFYSQPTRKLPSLSVGR